MHGKVRRDGFSMVESLVAVSITAVAGAALLTSLSAAVQSSTDAMSRGMARGLAEQMMDEIAAVRFPRATDSRPSGGTREEFDDIDDYAGWRSNRQTGPTDRSGRRIGQEGHVLEIPDWEYPVTIQRWLYLEPDLESLRRFRRDVVVERLTPNGASGWNVVTYHTDFRRVTVRVALADGQGRSTTLSEISRIFSYVPVSP